jgi:hypothetical protein
MPTAFRPGRLNNVEILERIFPMQKRTVLELVLQGCNGELVKAIEHFLSAQDTIIAQHQAAAATSAVHGRNEGTMFHPYLHPLQHFKPANTVHKSHIGGLKSAFTPLSPNTPYASIHSAFSPRAAAFTTDALLGRTPVVPSSREDIIAAPPPAHYLASFAHLPHMTNSLSSHFLLAPYRHLGIDMTQSVCRERQYVNKTPSDSDRSSDSPCEDVKEN